MAEQPLSIAQAVDLIRAAAEDTPPPPEPEAETAEQQVEAPSSVEPEGDFEGDVEAVDAEEVEAETETPEEIAEDPGEEYVELPDFLQRGEDGQWLVETNVFGEKSLETLDNIVARAQKDKAADSKLVEAKEQARLAAEQQRLAAEQLQTYHQTATAMQQELEALQAAATLTPEQEAALAEENPKALLELRKMQEARTARLAEVANQQHAARAAMVEHNQRLALDLLPEWRDPEVLNRERNGIVETARAAGFSDQEVYNDLVDARYLPIFRKAWMYDMTVAKQGEAKTKARKAPKLIKKKPPVPQPSEGQKAKKVSMDRLAKTGKMNDAVAALLARRS